MRRLGKLLLLVLASVTFSCSGREDKPLPERKADAPPAYGDALVISSSGDASNLIPLLSSDSVSHAVAGLVYNGLVKYDKNYSIVGDLAESWTISPDGLTMTFRLRRDVKWQDGAPFTSRDVMYTYRVTVDPKTPTAYAEDFRQVLKAEAPDPYTFRVTYAKPFAPALASWGVNILPAHLLEGKDITKSPLTRNPVGTGPFRLSEWVSGQKIVLEANPTYFEGRPYLDRYIFRIIPDASTSFMELKAGGIDMMALNPVQFQRSTDTPNFRGRFNKFRYPGSTYAYIGYNLRNPLFADRRVRQALSSAINKDEIIHGVLLGMGIKAHGPLKPGTWAYKKDVADFDYDPKRAAALLAEAGWKEKDSEGILVKDGKQFVFTLLTNSGGGDRPRAAQIIQRRLREVGIRMKIRVLEWSSFVTNFIDTRNFEAVLLGWTLGQDPDIYDVWHSSKTGVKELNFIGYRNAEVDRLLDEGRSTFDTEKRKKAYYRIQDILAYDQPYTFLYVPEALPVVDARIRGIVPAPAGISYDLIRWYVPKEEQRY